MTDRDAFLAGFMFGSHGLRGETGLEAWERFQAGDTPSGVRVYKRTHLSDALRSPDAPSAPSAPSAPRGPAGFRGPEGVLP